jgi:hypothetical protein
MGWFKRNLFFAIGGIVTLGLLGAAGFYDFKSWGQSKAALDRLTEVVNTLTDLNKRKPLPGTNNIALADEQRKQLEAWIGQTRNYFQPINPIPKPTNGPVTDPLFASTLHRTLADLKIGAGAANVALPPDFAFSFSAYVAGATTTGDRLTFAPGSLEPLSVQLGEVKTISEVLFGAGINTLDGIQRLRVSPDDASGPQTDYLDELMVTNDLAVMTPYQVTFRSFSPEIARVFEGFAASSHGFIIKAMTVQPAGTAAATAGDPGGYNRYQPAAPVTPAPSPVRGGMQAVLKEQLLRVTMIVEVVKLTPRN